MPSSRGPLASARAAALTSLLCAAGAAAEPEALFSIDTHGSHLSGRVSAETGRFEACVLRPAADAAVAAGRLAAELDGLAAESDGLADESDGLAADSAVLAAEPLAPTARPLALEMHADYSLSVVARPLPSAAVRPETAHVKIAAAWLGEFPVADRPGGEWRVEIPPDATAIGLLATGGRVAAVMADARFEWRGSAEAFRDLLACAELAGSFDPHNDALSRALHPDDRPGTPARRRLVTLLRLSGFRQVRTVRAADMGREPGALVWKTRSGHGTAYTETRSEHSDADLRARQSLAIAESCAVALLERSGTAQRFAGYSLTQSEFACPVSGAMTVVTSILDFIDVVTLAAVGESEIEQFAAANHRMLAILAALLPR